jgi:tartrate dehydrogenase/decarboxylase/D-malate dehydrogenase
LRCVPEGLRVLETAASAFDFTLDYEQFDYASADYYTKTGAMLPAGWFDELNRFDAIFFGAVGWPEVVPDHISLWGSLLQFRRHFDQYEPPAGQTPSRHHEPARRPRTW